MDSSIKLGKVLGIPIRLHFTWFIIFALVTVSLSLGYFPDSYPQWSKTLSWIIGISTSLLFFASVIAHELSHSIISARNGIPVKSITLFIFGGVARISREADKAGSEFKMAIAGPICSLLIGVFFGLVWLLTNQNNQTLAVNLTELLLFPYRFLVTGRSTSQDIPPIAALSIWLFTINITLAAFNLIPGFPLDGGRVLRSILWRWTGNMKKATHIASWVGRGVAYVLIFRGIFLFITGNVFNGIWFALIGWFLQNAASSSYKQVVMKDALQKFTARDALVAECDIVPPSLSLGRMVSDSVLPRGKRCFVVIDEGKIKGMITLRNIKSVPQMRWDYTNVENAMTPLSKLETASPEEDAGSLMERMDELDINQIPVVSDGNFLGLVTREGLIRVMRTRLDLRM